jgi:hypothetical protein
MGCTLLTDKTSEHLHVHARPIRGLFFKTNMARAFMAFVVVERPLK